MVQQSRKYIAVHGKTYDRLMELRASAGSINAALEKVLDTAVPVLQQEKKRS